MAPNMAVYRERSEAYLERVYADAWCETYFAEVHAGDCGDWSISVWSEARMKDVSAEGKGFMGAYKALMEKIESEGIMGSFEVVE